MFGFSAFFVRFFLYIARYISYSPRSSRILRFVVLQVSIKQATGLPPSLSNFVFCQYSFWNNVETTAPESGTVPSNVSSEPTTFRFEHTRDFTVPATEEFLEHCAGSYLQVFRCDARMFSHYQSKLIVKPPLS